MQVFRFVDGTLIGILDAVGFFLVILALFLPVFWLVGYFFFTAVWGGRRIASRSREVQAQLVKKIEMEEEEVPPTQKAA